MLLAERFDIARRHKAVLHLCQQLELRLLRSKFPFQAPFDQLYILGNYQTPGDAAEAQFRNQMKLVL